MQNTIYSSRSAERSQILVPVQCGSRTQAADDADGADETRPFMFQRGGKPAPAQSRRNDGLSNVPEIAVSSLAAWSRADAPPGHWASVARSRRCDPPHQIWPACARGTTPRLMRTRRAAGRQSLRKQQTPRGQRRGSQRTAHPWESRRFNPTETCSSRTHGIFSAVAT
jgi:hypothetical protein